MKDRKNFKNYGKGVLSFGKHKGKTIKEIINNKDYSYIIWLSDNVRRITVADADYNYCKRMVRDSKNDYHKYDDDRGSYEAEAWDYALPNHSG